MKQVKEWNLHRNVIQASGGALCWGRYVFGMDPSDENSIDIAIGKVFREGDTLILSPWKVMDEEKNLKTAEEVKEYLESLPKWDRTKYYVEIYDIGMSGLMLCDTGEEAPEEVQNEIMPKLGFTKSPA